MTDTTATLVALIRHGATGSAPPAVSARSAVRRLRADDDLAVVRKWSDDPWSDYAVFARHIPPPFGGAFGGDCGFAELDGDTEPVVGQLSARLAECPRCDQVLIAAHAAPIVPPEGSDAAELRRLDEQIRTIMAVGR